MKCVLFYFEIHVQKYTFLHGLDVGERMQKSGLEQGGDKTIFGAEGIQSFSLVQSTLARLTQP